MLSEYYESANSFTYNGINSLDMGLFIMQQEAADNNAQPVISTVSVPARGTLIEDDRIDELDNQLFEDYERVYKCCLAEEDMPIEETAKRIYHWLYGPGIEYGKLYDTYDREYYTEAYVAGNASVSELAKRLLVEADITFTCKAYKRAIKGDQTITLTKADTIYNTYGFTTKPYIKITGTGGITLYINDRAHTFRDVDGYIEIDSELMNAFRGDILQNNKMLTAVFPRLAAGKNQISWAGSVTKVEIIPRWCSL